MEVCLQGFAPNEREQGKQIHLSRGEGQVHPVSLPLPGRIGSSGQGWRKEGDKDLKRPIGVYSSLFSLSLRGFGGGKDWAERGICGGPRTRVC